MDSGLAPDGAPRNDVAVPRTLRDAPRKRRGALLIRGPSISVFEDLGPGSAKQRCTLHRVRDTRHRLRQKSNFVNAINAESTVQSFA